MKILVIHATAGAGHKKAAEAIYNGLQKAGSHEAQLVDALDYTNPFFKLTYPATYTLLVTKFSFLWGFFFALLDIPWLQPAVHFVRRCYNGFNARALEQFLKQEQFDCVITTQFLSAEVTAYLKRTAQIKSKVVCVVTDFDVHRIWVNKGIDHYACASDFTKEKLIQIGVPASHVSVTGIPTDAKFAVSYDTSELKRKLGLKEGMLTALMATGSFGMGPIADLVQALKGYQLIVVCGHNKKLYEDLKPLANDQIHILPLVNNMHELMAVSDVMVTKPGGLSIAEALVMRLPMIFFSAIPGQEMGNIHVLKKYHVADDQLNVPQIISRLEDLNASPMSLDQLRQQMTVLSKPNAVKDIIALL